MEVKRLIIYTQPHKEWYKYPDLHGYLDDFVAKKMKQGRKNGMLYVQQAEGVSWSFEIWHTKVAYFVEVNRRTYYEKDGQIVYT